MKWGIIMTKEQIKKWIKEDNIELYSSVWASDSDPVIRKLFNQLRDSFKQMMESYILLEYGTNFYEAKDFTKEQYQNEFIKRFNNFYITIEIIKNEIKNLSKEDINIIRQKTIEVVNWHLEILGRNANSQANDIHITKRIKLKRMMKTLSDNEIKDILYYEMPFEWINEYNPYPIEGVINENSKLEIIDDNIEKVYNRLCRNYNFKEKLKYKEHEKYNRNIYFPYYDASDPINMTISQVGSMQSFGDLYPGIPMCIDKFNQLKETNVLTYKKNS